MLGGDSALLDMPLRAARAAFERRYLQRVLAESGGNVAEAARRAGVARPYFYEKMKHLGLSLNGRND